MSASILTSTKKILGIAESYTAFDADIATHINTAFSTLTQLGVGPAEGFMIEDETAVWDDFLKMADDMQYTAIKSYVYLRARLLFDPPTTSFMIAAFDDQRKELEWRLNVHREETAWVDPNPPSLVTDPVISSISPASAPLTTLDLSIQVKGFNLLKVDYPADPAIARITCLSNGVTYDGGFTASDDTDGTAQFAGMQSGAGPGPSKFGIYSSNGVTLLTNEVDFQWT